MRLAFISLFKPGSGGGGGRVAHEMAEHFAAHHEVVMICPAEDTGLHLDGNLMRFGIRSAGEGEFAMPALSTKTVSALFDFLDTFNPDVVHAHDPALIGLIGQIWARMNLVPFFHTSHVLPSKTLDFGMADALDLKLLQMPFSESFARQLLLNFYHNCDAIIALNRSALESIREFGYEGKIFVIPNGRDLQRYHACRPADISTPQKRLIFIGYISERKNQIYLLQALRYLPPNYQLEIVGKPLNPEYGKELQALCQIHGLRNAEFVGQVAHEEIPAHLERSHLFVSASKMEVQSLVVIEALASGTPVVGLSNETIDELVDDEVGCRLAKETTPKEFAECIERLASLVPQEYAWMATEARQRVAHLDWSNIVEQTVQAYRLTLEEKRTSVEEPPTALSELVAFMPSSDLQDLLVERLKDAERFSGGRARFLPKLKWLKKIRTWKRVPQSTWLLTGLTILVSVVGYFVMKYKASLARLKRSASESALVKK